MHSRAQSTGAARKILSRSCLLKAVSYARSRGKRLVFTNGCFDLLHAGHITLLERAKACGDILIVGVNSDRSVRKLKGPRRPIVPERDRALLVAALSAVDFVTIFREDSPAGLISALRPNVLVKGADWALAAVVGSEVVRSSGGRVVRVPIRRGCSTTRLIQKLKSRGS